jgi:hypothetical protein
VTLRRDDYVVCDQCGQHHPVTWAAKDWGIATLLEPAKPRRWLGLRRRDEERHFCGWDCLADYACKRVAGDR